MELSDKMKKQIKQAGIKYPGVMGADNLDDDMEGDGMLPLFPIQLWLLVRSDFRSKFHIIKPV